MRACCVALLAGIAVAADTAKEVTLDAPPWAAWGGSSDSSRSNCDVVEAELKKTQEELAQSRELQRQAELQADEAEELSGWKAGRNLKVLTAALVIVTVGLATALGYVIFRRKREANALAEPLTGVNTPKWGLKACLCNLMALRCLWTCKSCSNACAGCKCALPWGAHRAPDPESPSQSQQWTKQMQASRQALRDAQTSMDRTLQDAQTNMDRSMREASEKMARVERAKEEAEKKLRAAETATLGLRCALKELREKCHQELNELRERSAREVKEANRRVDMADEKARKAQQELEVIKDAWKQSEEVTKRSRQASVSRSGSRTSLRSDTGRAPQAESSGDGQRFQGRQRAFSPPPPAASPPSLSRNNSQSSLGSAGGLAFDQVYRKAMAEMKRNKIVQTKDAGKRSTGRPSRPACRSKSASRSSSVDKVIVARTQFDVLFPEEEGQSETCHEAPRRGEPKAQHVYPRANRGTAYAAAPVLSLSEMGA